MSNKKTTGKEQLLAEEEKTEKFTSSSTPIKLMNTELIALWDRTEPISSKNPSIFRLDPASAIIKLSDYNKKTPHGWVVQPIDLERVPLDIDINNLIAIHWMNAESRLKTSKKNVTSFVAVVTRALDPLSDDNIKKETRIQNKQLQGMSKNSAIWSRKERKGFRSK